MRHSGEIECDKRRMGSSLRQRAKAAAGAEGRNRDAGLAAELEQRQNLIGPAGIKNRIGQMGEIPGAQAQPVGGASGGVARAFGQILSDVSGAQQIR